jgi:hypothetical protein
LEIFRAYLKPKYNKGIVEFLIHISMNKLLYLIVFVLILSCEKVINVDLEELESQLVVEAVIDANDSKCRVEISMSKDFYGSDDYEKINSAIINVTNEKSGENTEIINVGSGIYESTIEIVEKSTYTISILIDGEEYIASCFLHAKPQIKSIEYEIKDEDELYMICKLTDDKEYENYYRCKLEHNFVNFDTRYYMKNDDENEKDIVKFNINTVPRGTKDDENKVVYGDSLSITVYSYDEKVYDYFKQMSKNLTKNSSQQDTPANPVNNFSKNILGYFSVHYSETRKTKASLK